MVETTLVPDPSVQAQESTSRGLATRRLTVLLRLGSESQDVLSRCVDSLRMQVIDATIQCLLLPGQQTANEAVDFALLGLAALDVALLDSSGSSSEALGLNRGDGLRKAVSQADGECMAFLSGSDHWTAPDTLHRQLSYLDQRRECAAVIGGFAEQNASTCEFTLHFLADNTPEYLSLSDIVSQESLRSLSSVMFRTANLRQIDQRLFDAFHSERLLLAAGTREGMIGVRREMSAVERRADSVADSEPSAANGRARLFAQATWLCSLLQLEFILGGNVPALEHARAHALNLISSGQP